jgi:hypothetical protein
MSVSYIIGHRGNKGHRKENLLCVIRWIKNLKDCEVIVVEQDSSPFLKEEVERTGVKYVFCKNAGFYNRSWGFNVGYKHSSGDVLYFGDNDLMVNLDLMRKDIETFGEKDTSSPYNRVYDCNIHETNELRRGGKIHFGHNKFRRGCNYAGGMLAFRRECFERTGGWGEGFEGWGGEDDHMMYKIKKLGMREESTDQACVHLHHERGVVDRAHHEKYAANVRQITELKKIPAEDCGVLFQKDFLGIGDVNKYG